MGKDAACEFGRSVKVALLNRGLTQEWLVEKLQETTGMYADSAYVSRILAGEKHPPKLVKAIKEIMGN